jgi:hypothetical protein
MLILILLLDDDECHDSDDENGDDDSNGEEGEEYLRKFFVLPDFHQVMRGRIKADGEDFLDHEQVSLLLYYHTYI